MDRSQAQTPQSPLPTFNNIFLNARLPRTVVTAILKEITVPQFVLHEMIAGNPVAPDDADHILMVFSQHTEKQWTRQTVHIPVLPTELDPLTRGRVRGEA